MATLSNPSESGHPEATQVSYRHDWLKEDNPDLPPAGINSTVEKRQTEDGHWGVYVDTEHTTTFPEKDKLIYEIEKKIIPGYSIEYDATDYEIIKHNGESYRFIKDLDFYGYGFANGRKIANPKAEILATGYKEMIDSFKEKSPDTKKKQEANKMEKEVKQTEEEKKKEDENKKENDEKKKKVEETKEVEDKEMKDFKEFKDFKTRKKEADEKIKAELKEIKEKKKPMIPEKTKIEEKEVIDTMNVGYKEAVFGKEKAHISVQWKEAAKLHTTLDAKGMIKESAQRVGGNSSPFDIATKEIKIGDLTRRTTEIQYKAGLTTDSNVVGSSNTYWGALDAYEQTPAELNDIYGPVIISQLNEMHTTYNLLPKVDMSGDSAIRFRVKTLRPVADGSQTYGSTPGWDSNTERQKININFVTYRQDVEVEFEEIELAKSPGGIGDIYSIEMEDATETMMNTMNSDILTSNDTPAEGEPYTFETTIKTSGNIYGKSLTTYPNLKAASVTNANGAPLTLELMRKMIDDVKAKGAGTDELVFICHYTQSRKFKTLIQNIQRTVPTSARVGFEGRPELDGVALFEDYQANTDDLWLISLKHTKIGIKKAPTYVEFGLTTMARKGIIWTMQNLFCTKPSHNSWTYLLKTT